MSNPNEKEDTWFTATGEEEGKPLIFRSRIKVAIKESDYPNLVTVYWDYEPDDESGMPSEETNEAQISFENTLESLDSEAFGHLMLVVTGNERKEWYWYVSDVETWMKKFNELLTNHSEYPIEIENSFESDWALYHNFISGVEDIESINVS
jgi:hypothetical protein